MKHEHQDDLRKLLTRSSKVLAMSGLVIGLLSACSSSPTDQEDLDPMARENAIFNCKKSLQEKKKARFATLPPIVKRVLGDNQVLGDFERPPTPGQIGRAIRRFPLAGDSGGTWGTEKEAHLRTVSARVEKLSATEKDPEGTELLVFSFGQPGRVYSFPLTSLNSQSFGKGYAGGLGGKFRTDSLQIRVIDEHHVLVIATGGGTAKKDANQADSLFYPRDIYAVVRTYLEQSYAEETATQLSDYPVFGPGLDETRCDQ